MTTDSTAAGSISGPIPRPAPPPPTGLAAIARVAKADMIELGALAVLLVVAFGIMAGLVVNYITVRGETARLETLISRAGNIEALLAQRDKQLAEKTAELAKLQSRVPDNVLLKALDTRFDYRPGLVNLAVVSSSPWLPVTLTLALNGLGQLEATRFERSIDVKGKFKDVLALLADIESWPELVAIRAFNVKPPHGARGEVIGHFEVVLHQIAKKEDGR